MRQTRSPPTRIKRRVRNAVLSAEVLDTDVSLGVLQRHDDLLISMAFSGHGLLFSAHDSTVELRQWCCFLGEGH